MKNTNKPNSSLEKLRGIFFQVGLIVASGLVLVAFEWTTPVIISELPAPDIEIEGDMVLPPVTYRVETKPEIVQPEPPKVIDPWKIKVVPDPTPIPDPDPIEPVVEPVAIDPSWMTVEKPEKEEAPLPFAEHMPEFVGGTEGLFKFLGTEMKYPKEAKQVGIEGKVFVQFVVNKKGEVTNIKILKGIHPLLDKEAIRVVEKMPNWKPGKQNGKTVSVKYNLPLSFKIAR